MAKIGLITSPGGHLQSLMVLKPWWKRYQRFWVTEKRPDTLFCLKSERLYFAYFPEHRHIFNFIRNFFLAFRILRREKPDFLFSCGAGVALPFFLAGKILGIRLIFMETWDFIFWPTATGRVLYRLVDKFLIQDRRQKKFYSKGEYWGATL